MGLKIYRIEIYTNFANLIAPGSKDLSNDYKLISLDYLMIISTRSGRNQCDIRTYFLLAQDMI